MAQFQELTSTPGDPANVNVPTHVFAAKVYDDANPPNLVADFTGNNVINFPAVLNLITAEQRLAIMDLIQNQLILNRAGVS